ncbi:MAG: hypothetical protein WCJ39_03250 [bacterium]
MENLSTLLKTRKTVFSFQEVKYFLKIPTDAGTKSFLQRAKANGSLGNPYKGYWTLPNYDPMELACKIKKNAYISCETVLFKEGVFFQFYGNTFSCASDDSRSYTIDGRNFPYYKIKTSILHNPIGIRQYDNYRIATPERALCDFVYLYPRASIDAPESINKVRLKQILPIYPRQTALYIQKLLDVEY